MNEMMRQLRTQTKKKRRHSLDEEYGLVERATRLPEKEISLTFGHAISRMVVEVLLLRRQHRRRGQRHWSHPRRSRRPARTALDGGRRRDVGR